MTPGRYQRRDRCPGPGRCCGDELARTTLYERAHSLARLGMKIARRRAGSQGRAKDETPRSPDPVMWGPSASREEKRMTRETVPEKRRSTLTTTTPIRETLMHITKLFASSLLAAVIDFCFALPSERKLSERSRRTLTLISARPCDLPNVSRSAGSADAEGQLRLGACAWHSAHTSKRDLQKFHNGIGPRPCIRKKIETALSPVKANGPSEENDVHVDISDQSLWGHYAMKDSHFPRVAERSQRTACNLRLQALHRQPSRFRSLINLVLLCWPASGSHKRREQLLRLLTPWQRSYATSEQLGAAPRHADLDTRRLKRETRSRLDRQFRPETMDEFFLPIRTSLLPSCCRCGSKLLQEILLCCRVDRPDNSPLPTRRSQL